MSRPVSSVNFWPLLVLSVCLATQMDGMAQTVRGINMGNTPPQLSPTPHVGLLNNGSLSTWANPNANLPNQNQYSYIAAIPLGDRLGYNGIVYDPTILPNLGFTPSIQSMLPGPTPPYTYVGIAGPGGNAGANNGSTNLLGNNAARMARQQALLGMMGSAYSQQAMMQAMYNQQAMMQAMYSSYYTGFASMPYFPGTTAGGFVGIGIGAPLNPPGFGAGFGQNADGGF